MLVLNSNPFHEIRNQMSNLKIEYFFIFPIPNMNRLYDMHDGTDVFFFILIFMNERGWHQGINLLRYECRNFYTTTYIRVCRKLPPPNRVTDKY